MKNKKQKWWKNKFSSTIVLKTFLFKVELSGNADGGILIFKSLLSKTPSAFLKLDPEIIMKFANDVCMKMHRFGEIESIPEDKIINLHENYFCAETIRDIYSNIISDLQADNSGHRTNNIVSFGHVLKNKPERIKYIEMCENSAFLDYIPTKKFNTYSKDTAEFKSVLDLKKSHKYFIDLAGHTYSTKSYLFLASKRVYFSSEHPEVFEWEKNHLKPWENYVPVKSDLSDLMDNYQIIESDPKLYEKIIQNNINLLQNQISPELMLDQVIKKIASHVKFA
tara:strand:+ start:3388 stop:4227 length:840 start_codon:yes stop_codon:yes gene_type:complete